MAEGDATDGLPKVAFLRTKAVNLSMYSTLQVIFD